MMLNGPSAGRFEPAQTTFTPPERGAEEPGATAVAQAGAAGPSADDVFDARGAGGQSRRGPELPRAMWAEIASKVPVAHQKSLARTCPSFEGAGDDVWRKMAPAISAALERIHVAGSAASDEERLFALRRGAAVLVELARIGSALDTLSPGAARAFLLEPAGERAPLIAPKLVEDALDVILQALARSEALHRAGLLALTAGRMLFHSAQADKAVSAILDARDTQLELQTMDALAHLGPALSPKGPMRRVLAAVREMAEKKWGHQAESAFKTLRGLLGHVEGEDRTLAFELLLGLEPRLGRHGDQLACAWSTLAPRLSPSELERAWSSAKHRETMKVLSRHLTRDQAIRAWAEAMRETYDGVESARIEVLASVVASEQPVAAVRVAMNARPHGLSDVVRRALHEQLSPEALSDALLKAL